MAAVGNKNDRTISGNCLLISGFNMSKLPITVIILTLNEEFNLPDAIENVKNWAEEIFIVDSCSTDRTVDIALEHGVGIVQRPFINIGEKSEGHVFCQKIA